MNKKLRHRNYVSENGKVIDVSESDRGSEVTEGSRTRKRSEGSEGNGRGESYGGSEGNSFRASKQSQARAGPKQQRDASQQMLYGVGGHSFIIDIYFTEHGSWQGCLEWLGTRQKVHFRSELEMIKLIDEAVRGEHRHWDSSKKGEMA